MEDTKDLKILAIETSCDETSVAIICGRNSKFKVKSSKFRNPIVLSNVVYSQIPLHQKFGGVYPELASREHIKKIFPVIEQALKEAGLKPQVASLKEQVDAIAVTIGPGLIGSLLIGVNVAKTLAYAKMIPIIGVNHLEAHLYANFVGKNSSQQPAAGSWRPAAGSIFPALGLIVSGGHTILLKMTDHGKYQMLAETRDDAIGEAFDKVAKLLDLGYPGGPIIEKIAKSGDPNKYQFPISMQGHDDFSYSGLKTAVLYEVNKIKNSFKVKSQLLNVNRSLRADLAASFQRAAVEQIIQKTVKATQKHEVKSILVGGGVSANQLLRKRLAEEIQKLATYSSPLATCPLLLVPPLSLCGDNAAIVGATAYYKLLSGQIDKWYNIDTEPNLSIG